MQLKGLDLLLWVASFLANLCLAYVLWARRRASEFPIFTAWITMNVVRTIILFFTLRYGNEDAYFYAYWSLAIVDVTLQIVVAYEVAYHVFRPVGTWAPGVRSSFAWLLCIGALIACGLAWLGSPPTHTLRQAVVIRGNFFSSALMGEIFVGMIALSVTMGLPWKTHVARIAQALGCYSIAGIVIQALQTNFGVAHGTQAYAFLSHIRIGLYIACVIYWIVTLGREAPKPRDLPDKMRRQLLFLKNAVASELRRVQVWKQS